MILKRCLCLLLSVCLLISFCGFSQDDTNSVPIGTSSVGDYGIMTMDEPMIYSSSGTSSSWLGAFKQVNFQSFVNGVYQTVKTVNISGSSFTVPDNLSGIGCINFKVDQLLQKGYADISFAVSGMNNYNFGVIYATYRYDGQIVSYPITTQPQFGVTDVSFSYKVPFDNVVLCDISFYGEFPPITSGTQYIIKDTSLMTGSDKSFFESIVDAIKSIWDGIVNLPSKIASAIQQFFIDLGNTILNGLKTLFIPSEGYFGGVFDRLNTFFSERFGFLYYPIELFLNLCNKLMSIPDNSPYITIPELAFEGETFIPAMTYTFDFIQSGIWKTVHDYYLLAIDVAMIMAFVALLKRKYEEVMTN